MKVSVIIPAFNAQHTIGHTIKAIFEQDYAEKYEIIVVDDGSNDQTAVLIHQFSTVRYIHQINAGPAAARNHGASLAQGQFLAFTDSDCVPHKDWLSRLMGGFIADDVAVVMGSYGIANKGSSLATSIYKEIIFRHKYLLPNFPKVFGSYNFCVKKKIFDLVGGFNSDYRYASGEDNDLSYKIVSLGQRIFFERKALVDHYHPTQVKKYLKEQFRHGQWRVSMYIAHPTMVAGDGYTFWKDIVEVPWSLVCILGILATLFGLLGFKSLLCYILFPFLIFEVLFAHIMILDLKNDFFWGFIMFLRSFSRTLGLSTGFLVFLRKKRLNKS